MAFIQGYRLYILLIYSVKIVDLISIDVNIVLTSIDIMLQLTSIDIKFMRFWDELFKVLAAPGSRA